MKFACIKEFQIAASVQVRSNMSAAERSMKKAEQEKKMQDGYFGNKKDDTASIMYQLRSGEGAFANLYEKDQKGRTVVKAEYSDIITGDRNVLISVEDDLTEEKLSRSKMSDPNSLLTGRNIMDKSVLGIKNCKLASAFALTDCAKDIVITDGQTITGYQSGKNEENLLQAINSLMYRHLNPKAKASSDADADAAEEASEDEPDFDLSDDDEEKTADISDAYPPPPAKYFFPGFLAFVLFGPQSSYSSVLFKVTADDDKIASEGGTGGRRAILAATAAKDDAERKHGILGGGRGANLSEKMEMARLAQVEDNANQRHTESTILSYQLQLNSLQGDTKSILSLLELLPKKSPKFDEYVEKLEANRAKMDVINANLYELTTKPRVPSAVAAAVIGEVEDLLGVPAAKKARTNEEMPPLPAADDGNLDNVDGDGDMPVVGV